MRADEIEQMTSFALNALMAGRATRAALVRGMVGRWPDESGLAHVFALVRSAATIEAMFTAASPSRSAARAGYRLAALLACDLYALGELGQPHADGAALQRYWRETDDYFLTL